MAACGGKEKKPASPRPSGSPRKQVQKVELALQGNDMPDMDEEKDDEGNVIGIGESDPFAVLYEYIRLPDSVPAKKGWVERGRTETIQDDKDPKWKTTMWLDYRPEKGHQFCRIDVYDEDPGEKVKKDKDGDPKYDDEGNAKPPSPDLGDHDYMGSAMFTLGELVHHGAQQWRTQIKDKGKNPRNDRSKQYSSIHLCIANEVAVKSGDKPDLDYKWPEWERPKKGGVKIKVAAGERYKKKKEEKKNDEEEVEEKPQQVIRKIIDKPEWFSFYRNCPFCKTYNEYWIIKPEFTTPFKMNLRCGSAKTKGGCKQSAKHLIDPTKPGKPPKNAVADDRPLVAAR